MIKVILSTNTERKTVIVADSTVVRDLLKDNNVIVGAGTVSIDGVPLHPADLGMTLKELNVAENCFITSIVKSDNAR